MKKKLKKPSQGLTDGKFNFHVYQAFWSPTVSEESFECHYETGRKRTGQVFSCCLSLCKAYTT